MQVFDIPNSKHNIASLLVEHSPDFDIAHVPKLWLCLAWVDVKHKIYLPLFVCALCVFCQSYLPFS